MGRKENTVEAYLQSEVKRLGGFTRKVVYQGRAGSPDQWCFFPKGRLLIVECKSEDGVVSPIQRAEITTLRISGFVARVAYTKDEIDGILGDFLL
jgi:hypothetical protein